MACLLGLAGTPAPAAAADAVARCRAQSGATVVPLVELYTSEGCSSCPPADAWFSRQARGGGARASWLAFHVDYWDSIGWPDRFADPGYSRRQRGRVAIGGGRTVYTPQVMVGADTRVAWWKPRDIEQALSAAATPAAGVGIALAARGSGARLQVAVRSAPAHPSAAPAGGEAWLALYQDGLSSEVRAGENRGATLRHDRVVRALAGPWPLAGGRVARDVVLDLPPGADAERLGLVLFVQSTVDGATWQSVTLPLAGCGG